IRDIPTLDMPVREIQEIQKITKLVLRLVGLDRRVKVERSLNLFSPLVLVVQLEEESLQDAKERLHTVVPWIPENAIVRQEDWKQYNLEVFTKAKICKDGLHSI